MKRKSVRPATGVTVREAGRRGGEVTAARHGEWSWQGKARFVA